MTRGPVYLTAAVLAVVAIAFVVWWLTGVDTSEPVIVVMDTTSPVGIYDPATVASGETNADELTRVLADLPVRVVKENTSPVWQREHQVALLEPDLVIIHISAFVYPHSIETFEAFQPLSESIGEQTGATLRDLGTDKIIAFFGYLAAVDPDTHFLAYSRGGFRDPEQTRRLLAEWEGRFPDLRGRISTYQVEFGDEGYASWSDPDTAAGLRELVVEVLGLEPASGR